MNLRETFWLLIFTTLILCINSRKVFTVKICEVKHFRTTISYVQWLSLCPLHLESCEGLSLWGTPWGGPSVAITSLTGQRSPGRVTWMNMKGSRMNWSYLWFIFLQGAPSFNFGPDLVWQVCSWFALLEHCVCFSEKLVFLWMLQCFSLSCFCD